MNRAAWTTGTVVVEETRLHFHRTGESGRPVLVLLHGITDDGRCWTRVARDLAADFDILMPDARGHGRSGGIESGFSVPRLAADVEKLLDALEIGDAFVFGHSMGAITAVALAAERPDLVRGIILEDPPFDGDADPPDALITEMRAEVAQWRSLVAAERYPSAAAANPGWGREETDPWVDAKVLVDLDVIDGIGRLRGYDWRADLTRTRCPGLLVTGDPALGAIVTAPIAEDALRRWPSGRLVHVAGAGHCVHRDRWDVTMAPIRSFLREAA